MDFFRQSIHFNNFGNLDMVKNINYTDEVLDLNTNGGMIHSTLKCKVPLFGQAWFDSRSLTNILSMM